MANESAFDQPEQVALYLQQELEPQVDELMGSVVLNRINVQQECKNYFEMILNKRRQKTLEAPLARESEVCKLNDQLRAQNIIQGNAADSQFDVHISDAQAYIESAERKLKNLKTLAQTSDKGLQ